MKKSWYPELRSSEFAPDLAAHHYFTAKEALAKEEWALGLLWLAQAQTLWRLICGSMEEWSKTWWDLFYEAESATSQLYFDTFYKVKGKTFDDAWQSGYEHGKAELDKEKGASFVAGYQSGYRNGSSACMGVLE